MQVKSKQVKEMFHAFKLAPVFVYTHGHSTGNVINMTQTTFIFVHIFLVSNFHWLKFGAQVNLSNPFSCLFEEKTIHRFQPVSVA